MVILTSKGIGSRELEVQCDMYEIGSSCTLQTAAHLCHPTQTSNLLFPELHICVHTLYIILLRTVTFLIKFKIIPLSLVPDFGF